MDSANDLTAQLETIFHALPISQAMSSLSPSKPRAELQALVEAVVAPREVMTGLWLYVDDLERSHTISQNLTSATGSFWHAIMHRREGDYSNAKYWYRNVGRHPVLEELGIDPLSFTDDCQADAGQNSPTLVEMQRLEWKALFDWCLAQSGGVE